MKLSIVIVNYRTASLVVDAVESIVSDATLPSSTRILVVDGASGDGSAEEIERQIAARGWTGRVEFLPLAVNRGFAYANNRAIEYLDATGEHGEYVLMLNPDTVSRVGAVEALVAFMDGNPRAGICGSLLEDPDGTHQACAFRFPNPIGEFESEVRFRAATALFKRWSNVHDAAQSPVKVDWVSGASFMIRRSMADEIGLMSETYFLYYEEVDYCLRAARAGWECWHVPASRVVHLIGQSTNVTRRDRSLPRRPAYWFESRRHYFISNYGRTYAVLADLAWISGFGLRRARRPLRRAEDAPPYLFRDFLRHSAVHRSNRVRDASNEKSAR